jgi:DNA recombination protein RmuC
MDVVPVLLLGLAMGVGLGAVGAWLLAGARTRAAVADATRAAADASAALRAEAASLRAERGGLRTRLDELERAYEGVQERLRAAGRHWRASGWRTPGARSCSRRATSS